MSAAAAIWYFEVETIESSTPADGLTNPVAQTIPVEIAPEREEEVLPETLAPAGPVAGVEEEPTEIVDDFSDSEGTDCIIKLHYFDDDDDGIFEAYKECIPVVPIARHPYTTYSDEVLVDMAYGDAKAAEILGERWMAQASGENQPELMLKGVNYALRAAALSGDAHLIRRAAFAAYSQIGDANGPIPNNIIHNYVLREAAGRLGNESYSSAWNPRMQSLNLSPENKKFIEERVIETMERVAAIQTNVTGETGFAEVLSGR